VNRAETAPVQLELEPQRDTSESRTPHERRAQHGEIRDYLPNRRAHGRRVGLPSDDTQLAFWTLEHVIDHGRVVPDRLAATFADGRRIFGLGRTVRVFLERYEEKARRGTRPRNRCDRL